MNGERERVRMSAQHKVSILGMSILMAACAVEDGGRDSQGAAAAPSGEGGGKADDARSSEFCEAIAEKGTPAKFRGMTIEGDNGYVAQAIACHTDGTEDEDYLKALAVSMRSIAVMGAAQGAPCNNDCQPVCASKITDAHRAAASATAGEFLWYGEYPVFGFHTNGTVDVDADCNLNTAPRDRSTPFNACMTGDEVERSGLGSSRYDRGALNRDMGVCLAGAGRDYLQILRAHYGQDIEIGCGENRLDLGYCGGIWGDDEDDVSQQCHADNDSVARATQLDGLDDGDGTTKEDVALALGGEQWFTYAVDDTDTGWTNGFGDAEPWVQIEAPRGADVEVCQYFACNEGETSINCAGESKDLTVDGTKALGCCVSTGEITSSSKSVEINFHSAACTGAEQMDGRVWVSISSPDAETCRDVEFERSAY